MIQFRKYQSEWNLNELFKMVGFTDCELIEVPYMEMDDLVVYVIIFNIMLLAWLIGVRIGLYVIDKEENKYKLLKKLTKQQVIEMVE